MSCRRAALFPVLAIILFATASCLATGEPLSTSVSGAGACGDPGAVTLHRLNRAEYNNTVRDLLGDTSRPADDFPEDDSGHGFDNIADVLTTSRDLRID